MLAKVSGVKKLVAPWVHHDVHNRAGLGQLAGEVNGLVTGDAAGDTERYALAFEGIRHGDSLLPVAARVSLGSTFMS